MLVIKASFLQVGNKIKPIKNLGFYRLFLSIMRSKVIFLDSLQLGRHRCVDTTSSLQGHYKVIDEASSGEFVIIS
ncbi:hypothetical protein RPO_01040 [Rickettsia rickettsii str. Arizona]|nr:hypothetical protein RPO_01040 [Rickettsia rickettsii str. Arizona]AFB27157.1 hypothetical protein RPJ_01025 [Rickettsia rickettsii str. Hino]AFB29816.1 hypothetical protein RPM_01035 [Rickettsia rickettsii str. Hauke]